MGRHRTSCIWKLPLVDFENLIKQSSTYTEILNFFGVENGGGNFRTLKERISTDSIDDSHIKYNKQKFGLTNPQRLLKDLVVSKKRNTWYLKQRIIKAGVLENICSKCKQGPEWNGEFLSLQLDHINGDCKDHRIENLRILCPNCHSQTPTFAGKRHKIEKPEGSKTLDPNWRTKDHEQTRKVVRPSREELEKLIQNNTWTAIGRMFGVSDNAVRKWAKRYGIIGI